MRRLILSAIALVGLTSVSHAGDSQFVKEAPTSAPPTPFNWTGFYVGANVGVGAGDETLGFPYEDAFLNSGGALGGFQIGGNYQIGQIVLGLEADYDFANVRGAIVQGFPFFGRDFRQVNGGEIDGLGTARGRIGYAFLNNRAMAYATGGFAFGGVTSLNHGTLPLATAFNNDQSFGATGWALGGGVEYALANNLTIRGEYLFADLGSQSVSNYPGGARLRSTVNVARVGMNYMIGAPVGKTTQFAPAAPLPAFTWTGLHVGANVGNAAGTERISNPYGYFEAFNSGGVVGGFQVGGDYQIKQFVIGLEADYDLADVQGAFNYKAMPFTSVVNGGEINGLGTVRARLGYAFLNNRVLAYGAGGFAYGETKGLWDTRSIGGFLADQSFSSTGWTAGGGLEYAIANNWTVRGEYLFADLGSNTWSKPVFGSTNTSLQSSVHMLRFGLDYKFGGS